MIGAIFEAVRFTKRTRALRAAARAEIEAEGGTVESMGPIGLVLRSPFKGFGDRPVYLQAPTTYDTDSGVWFVRQSSDGTTQWVWKSNAGKPEPPVRRAYEVLVNNDVLALPSWVAYVLYLAFVFVLIYVPFFYL